MMMLDYASKSIRKPYRHFFLVSGMVCVVVTATFYFCAFFGPHGFPGPQTWMVNLSGVSSVAAFLGIIAGLCALTMLFFRFQSIPHSVAVVVAALMCIVGLPLVHLRAADEYMWTYRGHPAYLQFMYYGGSLVRSAEFYASYHEGRYPPHPATLILDESFLAEYLADGRSFLPYDPPSPLPPVYDWPSIASDVDAHSIFVYAAGDYDNVVPPANAILVYTKPCSYTPGHRVVTFGDSHSELIREKDLPKYFAESNAARAKLGLPPFSLDGPPPAPPTTLPVTP
jgi:hypothetical protein